jgi:hypothetical protein
MILKKDLLIHDITDWYPEHSCCWVDIHGQGSIQGIDTTGAHRISGSDGDLSGLWQFNDIAKRNKFVKELKQHYHLISDGCHDIEKNIK